MRLMCDAVAGTGGFVLLAVLIFITIATAIIIFGFRMNEAVWTHISFKECIANVRRKRPPITCNDI